MKLFAKALVWFGIVMMGVGLLGMLTVESKPSPEFVQLDEFSIRELLKIHEELLTQQRVAQEEINERLKSLDEKIDAFFLLKGGK